MNQDESTAQNEEMERKKIDLIKQILNDHQYELIQPIGFGGFSSIYLVHSQKYDKEFACKISDINQYSGSQSEVNVLAKLSHPNIVLIYDYFYYSDPNSNLNFRRPRKRKNLHKMIQEEKQFVEDIMDKKQKEEIDPEPQENSVKGINLLFVLLEYCPNGSLNDYLKKNKQVSPPLLYSFCSQCAEAVAYCHQNNVVHRDIKPGNFLLDANNRVKLADFGLSTFLTTNEENDFYMGSRVYMSPEVFCRKQYDPYKNDVWSLGVTFYELSSGSIPWQNYNDQQMRIAITVGNFNFQNCQGSAQFIKLLKEMLKSSEDNRCSIDYVKNHESLYKQPLYPFPKSLSNNAIQQADQGDDNNPLKLLRLQRRMTSTFNDFKRRPNDHIRTAAPLPRLRVPRRNAINLNETDSPLQSDSFTQSRSKPNALPSLLVNPSQQETENNGGTRLSYGMASGRRCSQPLVSVLGLFRNPQRINQQKTLNQRTFYTEEQNDE